MLLHYRSKIIVRLSISNNFKALDIDESDLGHNVCRDVQKHYKDRRHDVDFRYRDCLPELEDPMHNYSLKTLALHLLGEDEQGGGVQDHNAVDDARITMRLYRLDELAFKVNAHLWDVD